MARGIWCRSRRINPLKINIKMAKKEKSAEKEVQEVIVLVHDPILGSKYELQEIELEETTKEEEE